MARLIVKSPYIKCGTGQSAGGYLKYIATRERVEIIPDDRPPTNKQEQLIAKLVKDFPDAKELMEYEDYVSHPTKATASALITLALESNWDRVQGMEGYAKYIATRPRAERLGSHGLFGDEDVVDLDAAMAEVSAYQGNIWTHIISLKREDAARLGYDSAKAWRTLLQANRHEIAAAMNIPPNHFRWYAAFHRKEDSVHIHMVVFSSNLKEGYLTKQGIRQVKSAFGRRIFQQDLLHVYEQKTEYRDTLGRDAERAMAELIAQMEHGQFRNERLEQLVLELAERLHPDVVMLDPPRKGCDEATLSAVVQMSPQRVVYVSCNPATAARDAAWLQQHGYYAQTVQPVDLFPRTKHCEAVLLLTKLHVDRHIEVDVSMDELDVTAAESKATYNEIREHVWEHHQLKVSNLYIAQVKQKYGIIERENYNKPKSENAKQPQCPLDKENAIMEALKHFGMIL